MKINANIILLTLFAALFLTVLPAAADDLKITDTNLNCLQNQGIWTQTTYGSAGELLNYPTALDAQYQKPKVFHTTNAVTVADMYGQFRGECVSFAKALSGSKAVTGNWKTGRNVVASGDVLPGTVIATFDGKDNYDKTLPKGNEHTAVFREYIYSNKKITGFKVWDQNYVGSVTIKKTTVTSKVVGRHNLMTSGKGLADADRYSVVVIGKTSPAKPTLIRVTGTDKVYHVDTNGKIAWIPTANVFNSWGWNWNSIKDISQAEFNTYPLASPSIVVFKDGTFIKQNGGYEISLISGGARHPFASWDAFLRHGGAADQSNVKTVTPAEYTLNGLGSTYY